MAVRKFLVGQALESFDGLKTHLADLTAEEVLAALELESASRRRLSVIDRLISRAARLNELAYVRQLKEKFQHGTHETRKEPHAG